MYNRENLWPSTDGNFIFLFNGAVSGAVDLTNNNRPAANQLWTFTPDGHGSGNWTLNSVANTLTQSVAAADTVANGSACEPTSPIQTFCIPRQIDATKYFADKLQTHSEVSKNIAPLVLLLPLMSSPPTAS